MEDTGAHFVLCGCQRHGHIVMRDGEMSNVILCKSMAYDAARVLHQENHIDEMECLSIMREIRYSPLPHTLDESLIVLVRMDVGLDHMLAASPALKLDPWRTPIGETREEYIEHIHDFLDTFAPKTRQTLQ